MDFHGTYTIPAPRAHVWDALQDPDVLARCIPGCEALQEVEPGVFEGKVKVKIGPVRATFAGIVRLSEQNPPSSIELVGEGKGGVAGFASGSSNVELVENPEGTTLSYDAKAKVGGKMAQLGSRLVGGTVKSMADKFFAAFCEELSEPVDG